MFARVPVSLGILAGATLVLLSIYLVRVAKPSTPDEDAQWAEVLRRGEELRAEVLGAPFDALKTVALPKRRPGPDDWLAEHEEPGQSLAAWRASEPARATPERRTLYLQPVGDFTAAQQEVLALTSDYLERFFGLPVKVLPTWDAQKIPASARRENPHSGHSQLHTGYVLQRLIDARPDDALSMLALTSEDLFPDPDWNFVFGQASITHRIGVWSVYRNGDAEGSEEEKALFLRRTLATATHELLHVLGVYHCVAWECLANGINHQGEADAAPLGLCPHDLAKLVEATGVDPVVHHDRLLEFWRERDPKIHDTLRTARDALASAGERAAAPANVKDDPD